MVLAPAASAGTFPDAFSQSTEETVTTIESSGHLVLFSAAREINNSIRSDTMARLPVNGAGRLYLLARDASRRQARDHYLRWLQEQGARVLFECEGIRCGRSVVWANRVFGQAVLNGRDSDQDYLVALSQTDQGERWLTLVPRNMKEVDGGYVWRTDPRLRHPSPLMMSEEQVHSTLAALQTPALLIRARDGLPSADVIIYVLAAVVLVASLGGLFLLLSTG